MTTKKVGYEYLSKDLTENKITFKEYEYRLIQDNKNNYLYISFTDLKENKVINQERHPYLILESTILENYDLIKKYIDDSIEIENQKLNKDNKIPPLGSTRLKILIRSIFKPITFNMDSNIQEDIRTNFEKAIEKRRIYNIDKKTIKKSEIETSKNDNPIINNIFSFNKGFKEKYNILEEELKFYLKTCGIGLNKNKYVKVYYSIVNTLKLDLYTPKEFLTHLAEYLIEDLGVIIRYKTNDLYILDKKTKGYNPITIEELHEKVSTLLDVHNLLDIKILKKAIDYIAEYKKPVYNMIKFNNCIYDIDKHDVIESEEPLFTLIQIKHDYNPQAKGKVIYDYLYSSLERETPEETEKVIHGLQQIIGYLFTSGNQHTIILILVGISGSGKSLFANILRVIFGEEAIASVNLYELSTYEHATSGLVGKTLNIISDSNTKLIEDNGMIKQISGNDPMPVNPKGKDLYHLPPEEVPKNCLNC